MLLLQTICMHGFCILHLLYVFILIKRGNTIILLDRTSIGHCPLVTPQVHVPCIKMLSMGPKDLCLEDDLATSGYKH